MNRERFRDSAGILADYVWEVNHYTETGQNSAISIERTAVTTGVGYVRQQGQPAPKILSYGGSILTDNQNEFMQAYADACATRTIFYRGVDGVEHEVVITDYTATRKAVLRNPRSPNPWYWEYTIVMEVIS